MKKKLVFLAPSLVGAGAERVLCNILNNLNPEDYDLTLVLALDADHKFLKLLNCNVSVILISSKKSLKFSIFSIFKVILELKPDTVFVASGHLGILLSPFIPFFRKIRWIVRETNFITMNVDSKLVKWMYKVFYKNYNTIIAQCHDMKIDMIQSYKIPSSKICVINNPVDVNFIDKHIDLESESPFSHNDKINLVACGRLTYQKGFDMLIEQFSKLKDKDKYHLSIIGEGEKNKRDVENELRHQVIKFGLEDKVTFIGFQDNIYPWLKNADVFILSSRFEGFSNVLLEAIYCGTRVLVNRCPGGVSEVVINENIGYIFDFKTNDFEMYLNQLTSTNKNKNELMKYIKERYSVMSIIASYKDVLK